MKRLPIPECLDDEMYCTKASCRKVKKLTEFYANNENARRKFCKNWCIECCRDHEESKKRR